MPKMTHWNSPDPIEVSADKAAVYAAQGWQTVESGGKAPAAAVTTDAVDEPAPAKKTAAKKAPAKKTTKKAAKKS